MIATVRPTVEMRDNYLHMVDIVEGLPDEAFDVPAGAGWSCNVEYRKFLFLVAATQVAEASRLAHLLPLVAGDPLIPSLNACSALLRSGVDWRDVPLPDGVERLQVRDLSLFILMAEGDPVTRQGLDERDTAILADLVASHEQRQGPRVGDFVIWREQDGERVYRRIAHDWGDDVQTADGGSFHLGRYGVSFSGSLHGAIPTADLVDTGEAMDGRVWFWHHDYRAAGNGVDGIAPFRVYAYVGEDRLREQLAHWADDEGATPSPYRHILHMVTADGREVGNYPLDGYGEPVAVGRALRDWERMTGVMARKASDVVTIQGERATHYGVRVVI